MFAIRPLKQLLDQADQMIGRPGHVKEAVARDDVEELAGLLASASTPVVSTEQQVGVDNFEKTAERFNRYQAACEIEELLKMAEFEKRAGEEGYSKQQIGEALVKVASAETAKNLPLLATLCRSLATAGQGGAGG